MNQIPSEELLDGVRHIAAWDLWFSAKVGKETGDKGRRSYLRDELRSIMSELEIEVSHREARRIFGRKYKITYVVTYRGAIQLEFTDLVRDKTNLRTLESVRTYHAGEWERKLHAAYQKCLRLSNQWNSTSRLIDQLGSASHTPEEIVELIEATENPEQAIKLLLLSPDWESMCGLHIAYAVLGRCQEAKFILETVISIYPEKPHGYLLLGCLFRGALQNANPPPRGSISRFRELIETTGKAGEETLNMFKQRDPQAYRTLIDREYEQRVEEIADMLSQVTLEALGCSWDFAYKRAEELFKEAMRLSRDKKTREQAWSAVLSLKTYHKAQRGS